MIITFKIVISYIRSIFSELWYLILISITITNKTLHFKKWIFTYNNDENEYFFLKEMRKSTYFF